MISESFRVPKELDDKIMREVQRRKLSKTQLLIDAVEHYFDCRSVEPSYQMREICLKYADTCNVCGKHLAVHTYAMYARGAGAVCLECHAKRFGDKGIVRKYMKSLELSYTLKNLNIQCKEKAEKLREFNLIGKMQEMIEGDSQIRKLITTYLMEGFKQDEEEIKALEDIERHMQDQTKVVDEVKMFLRIPLRKKERIVN